jgi:hypothetical protein
MPCRAADAGGDMIKRTLLVLLPLLLVAGVVEVGLRTTHAFNARLSWTEPDRRIGWRFTPGREYWFFAENDHPITGRINSDGWRDRERASSKPVGVTRIAVLGDSFVEAFQVELDSTFVAILERTLNARAGGSSYEVMNFGRSGMSPAEEWIVLERDILPREPDVVVLLFTPQNDVADVNRDTAADTGRPFFRLAGDDSLVLDGSFVDRRGFRMREAINPFKQRSALVSLVMERYNAARFARNRQAVATGAALTREQRMCTATPDSMYAANFRLCRALIARMGGKCSEHGIRFVLASVPLVYEASKISEIRMKDATFDPDCFDRSLAELAASRGAEFVPLRSVFTEANQARGAVLHWQHWNYAGHRLVARELAGPLAK